MFENYSVFVKLSLQNEVSAGLLSMSGQFSRLEAQATSLQARLHAIRATALMGVGLSAGAYVGFNILDKMIKPASEYQHQLALMNELGMNHLEIVKATQSAWAATKIVPTSSVTSNLETIRHLRMVFADTQNATKYMPMVQQAQAVLRSVRGSNTADESYEMAKALELKGATRSPEMFMNQADMMTKAIIASGGKVGATDFLSTAKYGRTATSGWDDEFFYTVVPTLIQEMKARGGSGGGAGGPGNALMSAYQTVVAGVIPQKSLTTWQALGLLDPNKVKMNRVGSMTGIEPGAVQGTDLFMKNPLKWSQQVLLPALVKAGFTSQEDQKKELSYLFPNRTAGFVMTQMTEQAWKFQRDQNLIRQTKGLDSYQTLLKNDPQLAAMALQQQWNSLMAILGYQVMPALLSAASAFTPVLASMGSFFKDNQWAAQGLVFSLVGLTAALGFSGLVYLLTASFKGLTLTMETMGLAFGAGLAPLVGIGAAIGVLAVGAYNFIELMKTVNWPSVRKNASMAWESTKFVVKKDLQSLGIMSSNDDTISKTANSTPTQSVMPRTVLSARSQANRPLPNAGNAAKGGAVDTQPIHVNLHVDGHKIATVVANHIYNQATKLPNTTNYFDSNLSPTPSVINAAGIS